MSTVLNRAFYEAPVVKSKVFFFFLIACGAHLPRLPVEASFFAPSFVAGVFSVPRPLG
jgi:hypothetical protein